MNQPAPADAFEAIVKQFQRGDLQKALDAAKVLLEKFPCDCRRWKLSAAIHAGLGDWE